MHIVNRAKGAAPAAVLASLSLAGAIGLAAVGLSSCGPAAAQGGAMPPPEVTVAHPVVRTAAEWSEHPGRLMASSAVEVRPRVSGYLQAVHFRDGQMVTQGQLLFTLDALPLKARADKSAADVAQAQARLDRAQSELRRADALHAAQAISDEEYDTKKDALAQAVAGKQAAQAASRADSLDLGYTRVYAPISGRISDRRIDPGNLVTSETVLTQIVSVDPIHFEFSASEAELAGNSGRLDGTAPRQVLLQLEGEKGYGHGGRLDFVDNAIDPATGTIRARATFANADGAFTAGQFGRLRVLSATVGPVVLAPDAAIGADQSRKFVLVVTKDDKVEYRQVDLGPQIDGLRVVRKGLAASDRIIINGLQRAQPGQAVKPVAGKIVAAANASAQG